MKPDRIPCGVTGSRRVPLIPAAVARRIRICRTECRYLAAELVTAFVWASAWPD